MLAFIPDVPNPIGHTLQVTAAGVDEYVLAGHAVHFSCPDTLLALPGMQGKHIEEPFAGWYCPGSHSLHLAAPSLSE